MIDNSLYLSTRQNITENSQGRPVGTNHLNSSVRTREHLTTGEIERLCGRQKVEPLRPSGRNHDPDAGAASHGLCGRLAAANRRRVRSCGECCISIWERPVDGLGAMCIGYGGHGQSLTYQTTATFQVTHPANADFLIGFESQSSLGTEFDSAMLEVFVNSILAYQTSFASLADAQAFFTDNPVAIGLASAGPATVELVFYLTGMGALAFSPGGDGGRRSPEVYPGMPIRTPEKSNKWRPVALCVAMMLFIPPMISAGANQTETPGPWIVTAKIMLNERVSATAIYLKPGLVVTAAHLTPGCLNSRWITS